VFINLARNSEINLRKLPQIRTHQRRRKDVWDGDRTTAGLWAGSTPSGILGERPPEAEEFLKYSYKQILRILAVFCTFLHHMHMFFRACRYHSGKSAKCGGGAFDTVCPSLSASGEGQLPPAPPPMAHTMSSNRDVSLNFIPKTLEMTARPTTLLHHLHLLSRHRRAMKRLSSWKAAYYWRWPYHINARRPTRLQSRFDYVYVRQGVCLEKKIRIVRVHCTTSAALNKNT